MNIVRNAFDLFYLAVKPAVFYLTRNDPELAHEIFASFCRTINYLKLDKFIFDTRENRVENSIKISNAAGMCKNAEIPPRVLGFIGFNRVVIGTVTGCAWKGNPRPRVIRYPKTRSMVNWLGLPGAGARAVATRLESYGRSPVPLTVNIAPTPCKKGKEILEDIKTSVTAFKDNPDVDRFELNISCPNTQEEGEPWDAGAKLQEALPAMLEIVSSLLRSDQQIYLKISPDADEAQIENILSVAGKLGVSGFTLTNTTTRHDPAFIPKSHGRGGASGDALWRKSLGAQRFFVQKMGFYPHSWKIIACGGIDSLARMNERVSSGASEIQIYTPMIFRGTGLIRELQI